ncbi:hypothetical protein [Roseibium aggregatum]|uniref:hypothetical protein n=1 Tax=Roseibium aggregatum TaxID=187304 RepID=UPI0025AD6829|nr:hypothetical protein [Roseibium aggregatum]WJS05199.1 hypothetical protein QUB73_13215 [Roseibium aggregatum]
MHRTPREEAAYLAGRADAQVLVNGYFAGTNVQAPVVTGTQAEADEIERLRIDAARYNWLRSRDLDTISQGGVFAGMTPENVILNEEDLDRAIDAAMNSK